MTPALTVGPLSASMVERLSGNRSVVAYERDGGDLLAMFSHVGDGQWPIRIHLLEGDRQPIRCVFEKLRYIGERSEDGWITGSWPENPVGDRRVEWRSRVFTGTGDAVGLGWGRDHLMPIIAFRLVEGAAPARGSGSSAQDADTHRAADGAVVAAEAELRAHWHDFCDCDGFPTYDGFVERMEAAGLVGWRSVDADDLERAFADEKGITPGGMVYDLTPKGRAVYEATPASSVGTETRERRSASGQPTTELSNNLGELNSGEPEAYTTAGVGEHHCEWRLIAETQDAQYTRVIALVEAAKEAGWAMMEVVDGIAWERRQQFSDIAARMALALAALSPLDVTISDK